MTISVITITSNNNNNNNNNNNKKHNNNHDNEMETVPQEVTKTNKQITTHITQ